jgi:hypothetical protein
MHTLMGNWNCEKVVRTMRNQCDESIKDETLKWIKQHYQINESKK